MKKILFLSLSMLFAFFITGCDEKEQIELNLKTTDFQLVEGETKELLFELVDNDDLGVIFSSSDENIVTVSEQGVVTAISSGEATITLTAKEDESISKTVNVTVLKEVSVTFVTEDFGLLIGNTMQLEYTIIDNDNLGVTFESSNESIVTVSETGLVTGVESGKATVTVKSVEDSSKLATIVVTVSKTVTVEITTQDTSLNIGDTLQLEYLLVYNTNDSVVFNSSDQEVITVSETGLLSAVSSGVATIKVTSKEDETKSATITITVLKDVTLEITTTQTILEKSETLQIEYVVVDNDDLGVTYSSSNEEVITISETGLVQAVGSGVASIIVTSKEDSSITATIEITVLKDVTLELNTQDANLAISKSLQLQYSLIDNTSSGVLFTSSDENIVTVSSEGYLTAISSGVVTITVTSVEDNTVSATVEITVLGDLIEGIYVDAQATNGEIRQIGSLYLVEGVNLFQTISSAVNSVDMSSELEPAIITILEGTYSENVEVDLDYVIFKGPNDGINPNVNSRLNEAIITGQIKISGSSHVTISGLYFEGNGHVTIDKTKSVDTLLFINNIVKDNTSDASILLDYDDVTNNVLNVSIKNNLFENLSSRAWYIYFSKNVEITGNKVLEVALDNKIYGSYGTVNVLENEFANMGHRSIHIVGFTDGQITVNENYLHDGTAAQAPIAIWAYPEYSENVVIEVNYNVIDNVGKGLYIDMSYKNAEGSWVCDISTEAHANYNVITNIGNGSYYLGSAGCHTPNFKYNYFGLDDLSSMPLYRTDLATIGEDYYTSKDQIVYPKAIMVVSKTASDGDQIEFLDKMRVFGVDYFSSINDALEASKSISTLKNLEIYILEGTYDEDFTIRRDNIAIYGPNKGINPLTDTRVNEAVLTGKVFIGNGEKTYENIIIDGLYFTGGAQLRADVTKSVDGMIIRNNIAENIVYPSTNYASAFLMFDTTSKEKAANNISVVQNKFVNIDSYTYASAFLFTYVSNLDFIGNYIENTKYQNAIVGSDGLINVIGNEFTAVQNKALLIKNYTGGYINVSNNYFHDWTANQQAIAIYAGPQYEVNTTVIANYNHLENVGKGIYLDMSYKNAAGAWVTDIPMTAEANYNIFENITGSYYIATDSADSTNFKWNYFNGLVDLSTMGVYRVDVTNIGSDFYTSKEDVPGYTPLEPVAPTTLTIDNTETELAINQQLQMIFTIDNNATNKMVRWSTSDENLATIDNVLGILTTHAFGEVTIYAKSMIDNSIVAEYTITIRMDDMVSISTDGNPSNLIVGETIKLNANTLPVPNSAVLFSSSDSTIATVDEFGNVTTLKAGTVEITATLANDPTVKSTIILTVYNDLSTNENTAQALLNYLIKNQRGYVRYHQFEVIGWEGNYDLTTYDSVSNYYFDVLTVQSQIIPEGNDNRPGEGMNALPEGITQFNPENVYWVVIHDTGSSAATADAHAHANYVDNPSTQTSWHFTIDDNEIWQHLPTDERAYHAGDGSTNVGEGSYLGGGNRNGIGIEMAVNEGSDVYRTWQRTAKYAASLLLQYNLPVDHQVYHNDMSGKMCPNTLLSAGLSDTFKSFVAAEYFIQNNFEGATITFHSNNPDILDNTGRIISEVEQGTTVSYTISVTYNGETVTETFYTYVPSNLM